VWIVSGSVLITCVLFVLYFYSSKKIQPASWFLVENKGLEPLTLPIVSGCSQVNWANPLFNMLFSLKYDSSVIFVENKGLEPLTLPIVSGCSQVNWANPLFNMLFSLKDDSSVIFVENKGLEPLTPCVQGRCSKPTELIPRVFN
jgi:hypothetical protein